MTNAEAVFGAWRRAFEEEIADAAIRRMSGAVAAVARRVLELRAAEAIGATARALLRTYEEV